MRRHGEASFTRASSLYDVLHAAFFPWASFPSIHCCIWGDSEVSFPMSAPQPAAVSPNGCCAFPDLVRPPQRTGVVACCAFSSSSYPFNFAVSEDFWPPHTFLDLGQHDDFNCFVALLIFLYRKHQRSHEILMKLFKQHSGDVDSAGTHSYLMSVLREMNAAVLMSCSTIQVIFEERSQPSQDVDAASVHSDLKSTITRR